MKSMLITGGAGFIGTHLVERALMAGYAVRILDNLSPQIHGPEASYAPREGVDFRRGDVTRRADLEDALDGIDTIVHLAAETGTGQSMYEIARYYDVNVQGTALILDILANRANTVRKIVLASSRSVYGEGAYLCFSCAPEGARRFPASRSAQALAAHQWEPNCPVCGGDLTLTATREDDALAPASIYAATKLAQEEMIRVACGAAGIAYAILRFQNVFGEGQSLSNPYTGILSILSTRIRLGLPLPIFEDGNETRDFVHVGDVAAAILASVESDRVAGAVINVGMGRASSIMEVAQLLCTLMQSSVQPHITAQYRIGDIRHNFADITKLHEITGYCPAISLDEGMQRFCDWVKTQPIPQDQLDKANAELKARNLMG